MSAGAEALFGAARDAYRTRDLAAATARCDEGLRAAPAHAPLLHLRALLHLQAGEPGLAVARAEAALAVDPAPASHHHTLGYACRALGRTDDAERHYRAALERDPAYYEALLNLGALLGHQHRFDEAQACYERAARARPGVPHAHYNLGRLCHERDRGEEAARHYTQALLADPRHAPSEMNLGELAQAAGRTDEAIARYRRALALKPDYAAAHNNLGTALQVAGELPLAISHYRAALALDPEYGEARYNLGAALLETGARDEARACYERVLAAEPGHPKARFALAALRGENPEQPPAEHVRSLFDDYAPRFDAHLRERLGYRVPELLAARVHERCAGAPEVLDLGCGTGLFGAAVASFAGAIDGVDLSPRMLERARARGCYRRLAESDLVEFLGRAPPAAYDVAAATEVFIYAGALEPAFAEVRRVLRPGGLFAFSVETPAQEPSGGYALRETGRYAHSTRYVRALLASHAMAECLCEPVTLRTQGGEPVSGQIWIARKA